MAGSVLFQTEGDVISVVVPADHPGPYSALVRSVRQQLSGAWIDWVAVREAYRFGRGRPFPVARESGDGSADERAKVRFSPDGLTAYLILFPPKLHGQRLRDPELFRLIGAYGIPATLLDVQAVRLAVLRRSYREAEPIAKGRHPVDGRSAAAEWSAGVSTDPEGFLAAIGEGGERHPDSVLTGVEEDQALGLFHPPQAGSPGQSVTGTDIPAQRGGDTVQLGEGLRLSDEPAGQVVRAVRAGHLRMRGVDASRASVVPLLRIREAQELERWQNEVFPGSVLVEGDLEVRFPLRILGDLEVRGGLVRSSIEVMGSLFVRDGIIHHGRAPVKVGGVVSAAFLDRAWVVAHTVLVRRYSLQSRILARDAVLALAAQASICGGQVACRLRVEAGVLGSPNGMATDVAVANPAFTASFQDLYYSWAAALRAQCLAEERAGDRLVEAAGEWEKAAQDLSLSDATNGKIFAQKVHSGVSVRIGGALRQISNPVGPVIFSYERIGPRDRVAMNRT
ncbi:MAG: DUF342 domain-containing protein [Deltaproteobacteria bacterium]|nr:DUF342 domain-containing protein [Deltaproteobacteria bacterium]